MDIKKYLSQFNLSFNTIRLEYNEEYQEIFQKELDKNWIVPIEEKLQLITNISDREDIKEVITILKSSDDFKPENIRSLTIFISKINSIINIADRINNFKEGTSLDNNQKLDLVLLFNNIKNSDSIDEITMILNKNLYSFLPHIYSVVKHCQDPINFPIYYKFWKQISKEVLLLNDDYTSITENYRAFPENNRTTHFGSYFGFIAKKIISNLKDYSITEKEIKYLKNKIINLEEYKNLIDEQLNTIGKEIKNYWLYQPGEDAKYWEKFLNENIIGLGWNKLGDLSKFDSKQNIVQELQSIYDTDSSKKNDSTANWDFYNNMQIGDIVIVKKGKRKILGYGEVISEYKYDNNRIDYSSIRNVKWLKTGEWNLDFDLVTKTLTNITQYNSEISKGQKYYEYLLSIINNTIKNSKPMQNIPLNQILYGPPGTGKTYNTINKAVELANADFTVEEELSEKEKRNAFKEEYKRLVNEGQILFTTFHQSMTYEDFIEGIKPETKDNNVIYNIKNGIFKEIANKSLDNWKSATSGKTKIKPFDKVFQLLKDEWEENPSMYFEMKRQGYDFQILGFSDSSINFLKSSGTSNHTLSIDTLRDLYYGTREFKSSGIGIYYPSIVDKLKSYDADLKKESVTNEKKNYVLIIDEINRGNVSQIFGELITLIEEDKRLGNDEALEVTLPYSKEKFGVPSNLYIIGTMNTADRSVEALDTALRRRFVFEEMPPQYDLNGLQQELFGFKAGEILKTINQRIEKLLDRDHQIGHAYFINKNETTIVDSFYKNIIPLLQEYFFGDYGKIGLVLGSGFIGIDKYDQQNDSNSIFASFDYENAQDFEDKKSFKILGLNDEDFNFEIAIKLLMNKK